MATTPPPPLPLLLLLLPLLLLAVFSAAAEEFPRDGKVIDLDDTNFEAALSSIDFLFVDFYAPWCGHCKRLAPELDEAAPVLAGLSEPIMVAKVNADKYRKLGSKYGVDGFPTLMLFIHGVPIEYTGSRKADLLVRNLKKFVAPDVSTLDSDSAIKSFADNAGTSFPMFIGFGVNESLRFCKCVRKDAGLCKFLRSTGTYLPELSRHGLSQPYVLQQSLAVHPSASIHQRSSQAEIQAELMSVPGQRYGKPATPRSNALLLDRHPAANEWSCCWPEPT